MKRVFAAFALAAVLLQGCASARMSDHASDRYFRSGEFDQAIASLKKGVEEQGESGRDLLLYLLDLGLTLHTAGQLEESNKVFRQADQIADIKDYTSLATEGATLLTSDNIKDYKGEDFEKVMINTYLAMNYALLGNYEDALVECRLVNRKLHLMVTEGERKYKQNAFARYLSGIIYEADREWNDAYVDYKATREIDPSIPGLGRDLWRMAWLLRMPDEMQRWDEEYGLTKDDHEEARKLAPGPGKSEIVVLYENGISPVKRPNPSWRTLPRFYPRFNPVTGAKVEVDGQAKADTIKLHDIEATAIENLDEKYGALIAKKIAGIAAKEVVANQVDRATGNQGWGFLAKVIMYASDQADLRSWNLLPHDLQIARIPVEPGTHSVRLVPNGGGATLGDKTLQVEPGRKAFVSFRFVPR